MISRLGNSAAMLSAEPVALLLAAWFLSLLWCWYRDVPRHKVGWLADYLAMATFMTFGWLPPYFPPLGFLMILLLALILVVIEIYQRAMDAHRAG